MSGLFLILMMLFIQITFTPIKYSPFIVEIVRVSTGLTPSAPIKYSVW